MSSEFGEGNNPLSPLRERVGVRGMEKAKILIVDDEPNMRFFLSEALGKEGYACSEAGDGQKALEQIREDPPDIVLLDLKMPRMGGMEALRRIRSIDESIAVIIITAFGSRETAYEAVREGAYDFFSKPADVSEVRTVVGRAAERVHLLRTVKELQKKTEEENSPESFLGKSSAVLRLREMLIRLSGSDSTALITGESGTGKELAAKIIHYQSKRRLGPFIAVNCAAIPETLLEAELFGHEKGAFTGAHQQRIGKFESAEGGTAFLDEIGDMPAAMQTKILRVLQERTFERVGGVKPVHVDIRLIAATNRDLSAAVSEGRFREDLFYRLNVVPVNIPPLRERREDIPLLAEFFLKKCLAGLGIVRKRLMQGAIGRLMEYRWPGNVRELDNIIQRAVLLSSSEDISEPEMTEVLGGKPAAGYEHMIDPDLFSDPEKTEGFSLHARIEEVAGQIEKQIIQKALERNRGRRQETADMLAISRKSLHNKMKKYGIS